MRALIVDDEPLARSRLVRMLEALGTVRVVGEAADGQEALVRIAEEQPDVVFLDIRMPGLDGLAVASATAHLAAIVFTTAHHDYALDAFDAAAVDYLLKPIKRERLQRAVERVGRQLASGPSQSVAAALKQVLDRQHSSEDARVCAHDGADLHLFDAREITRFYSSAKYTVFRHEGREHLVEESLNELERRLSRHGFFRVHRAELVNLKEIRTLRSDDSGAAVVLSDGQGARVSRRLVADLKRALAVR